MILKTLKDLKQIDKDFPNRKFKGYISFEELRQEAFKWIKGRMMTKEAKYDWKLFFDLFGEEDLDAKENINGGQDK